MYVYTLLGSTFYIWRVVFWKKEQYHIISTTKNKHILFKSVLCDYSPSLTNHNNFLPDVDRQPTSQSN